MGDIEHAIMKIFREIELLEKLDHPNIVKYVDHFKANDQVYIELEWAGSGDLKNQISEYARRKVVPDEATIWYYFSQIATAVEYLHAQNIVHRDLKPANIMITSDKTIKVGDFGLSRSFHDGSCIQSFVGTPLYMAPEVLSSANNEEEGYCAKCDIWSLGCILYELATLSNPFYDASIACNIAMIVSRIRQRIYTPLKPPKSDMLCSLSSALLVTDPEQRPDASAVVEDADRALKQFNVKELTSEIEVGVRPKAKIGFWADDGDEVRHCSQDSREDSDRDSDSDSDCEEVVKSPVIVHHRKDSLEDVCRKLTAMMDNKIAKAPASHVPLFSTARDLLQSGEDCCEQLNAFATWLGKQITDNTPLSPEAFARLIRDVANIQGTAVQHALGKHLSQK